MRKEVCYETLKRDIVRQKPAIPEGSGPKPRMTFAASPTLALGKSAGGLL